MESSRDCVPGIRYRSQYVPSGWVDPDRVVRQLLPRISIKAAASSGPTQSCGAIFDDDDALLMNALRFDNKETMVMIRRITQSLQYFGLEKLFCSCEAGGERLLTVKRISIKRE
eukprot:scaffold6898_cov149-Amphora_coffeaeformis.AAC.6